jgi:hypothetical protein
MPNCSFCGKLCATASGLERHIIYTPDCKKASGEKFGHYANSIWEDKPVEQPPLVDIPNFPDFHLEEDIQIAEDMLNNEGINLLPVQEHLPVPADEPRPQHATVEVRNNVEDSEDNDGGRYIEYFPQEYMAGATWGRCKPLFESVDEEQKRVGGSCWAPFEDEDEWQLAEWLIRNVGQKQTDTFLKLSIVSSIFHASVCQYILSIYRLKTEHDPPMGVIEPF